MKMSLPLQLFVMKKPCTILARLLLKDQGCQTCWYCYFIIQTTMRPFGKQSKSFHWIQALSTNICIILTWRHSNRANPFRSNRNFPLRKNTPAGNPSQIEKENLPQFFQASVLLAPLLARETHSRNRFPLGSTPAPVDRNGNLE